MKLAIIPARSGSKRIKNKNILDFFGKPLIYYALKAAKESKLFDEIHVSTDSEEIKNIVEKLGFKVDFLRDKKLSDDYTGLVPVLKWVNEEYKKMGKIFEDIFCIMPAAPLLKSVDLDKAYRKYKKFNSEHPLLVVSSYPVPTEWAFYRNKDGILTPKNKKSLQMRSQDIKQAFYEAGPFSIFNAKHLDEKNCFEKISYISLLIDKSRAIDIDNHEDLELAKIMFLGSKKLKQLENE